MQQTKIDPELACSILIVARGDSFNFQFFWPFRSKRVGFFTQKQTDIDSKACPPQTLYQVLLVRGISQQYIILTFCYVPEKTISVVPNFIIPNTLLNGIWLLHKNLASLTVHVLFFNNTQKKTL